VLERDCSLLCREISCLQVLFQKRENEKLEKRRHERRRVFDRYFSSCRLFSEESVSSHVSVCVCFPWSECLFRFCRLIRFSWYRFVRLPCIDEILGEVDRFRCTCDDYCPILRSFFRVRDLDRRP
jgi:hypothetical protein